MKKTKLISFAVIILLIVVIIFSAVLEQGIPFATTVNPVFSLSNRNTGDPSAYVFFDYHIENEVCVVVTSSDLTVDPRSNDKNVYPMDTTYGYATATFRHNVDYNAFTDWWDLNGSNGSAPLLKETNYSSWADQQAKHLWAPDLIGAFIDGKTKFILFVSALESGTYPNNRQRIGVSFRDYDPYGPFTAASTWFDIRGTNVPNNGFAYDPGVFQTLDEKYYMTYCDDYWWPDGDSHQPDGRIHITTVDKDVAGKEDFMGGDYIGQIMMHGPLIDQGQIDENTYLEGPDVVLMDYNGNDDGGELYYLIFAAKKYDNEQEWIGYCTATPVDFETSKTDCWEFRGWVMKQIDNTWTNHASLVEMHPMLNSAPRYYLFYHISKDGGIENRDRQACCQEIFLDAEDGAILGASINTNQDAANAALGYNTNIAIGGGERLELSPPALSRDFAPSENNRTKVQMYVKNSTYETMSNFKVRYYFNVENGKTPWVDDYDTPDCTPYVEHIEGSLWAVVLDYSSKTLEPLEIADDVAFGLQYQDWSYFDKSNDFSQPTSNGFTITNKIAIFNSSDELIYGNVPESGTWSNNIRSPWGGKMLTASNEVYEDGFLIKCQDKHQDWNTQDWVIKPIEGTNRVRIYNSGKRQYLTVKNDGEDARVVSQYLHTNEMGEPDWSSQEWTIEKISGSNEVRFKNAYGGRYLTVEHNGDWADLWSKNLKPLWPSQKWVIE